MSLIEYEILKIRFLILAHLHTLICKLAHLISAKATKIYKQMGFEEAADENQDQETN